MKILLIYPDIVTSSISFCPAFHILSAVLKKEGCEVDLLHINSAYGIPYDKKTILSKISKEYSIYALTATSFNYKHANEIAGWLKEKKSGFRILGGSHATIQPEDFEDSNFDIFCVGAGEEPMVDFVRALKAGEEWINIPNFITRTYVGIFKNPVRPFIKNLDDLPFNDFEITDTKKILKARDGFLSISFSRGCPFECTFCINHLYKRLEIGGSKMSEYLRRRSPELVIEELESLVKVYDIKFFNTDDDLLVMDKKWMRKFTSLYTERIFKPFGIKYLINARATEIDEETAKMFSSSGCHEVRIGVETGNEGIRNGLLKKKVSDAALLKACTLLEKYNVRTLAFLMLGVPGESWQTYSDTVNLVIKLKPTLIRMTYLFPYKHTEIYDYCVGRSYSKTMKWKMSFTAVR